MDIEAVKKSVSPSEDQINSFFSALGKTNVFPNSINLPVLKLSTAANVTLPELRALCFTQRSEIPLDIISLILPEAAKPTSSKQNSREFQKVARFSDVLKRLGVPAKVSNELLVANIIACGKELAKWTAELRVLKRKSIYHEGRKVPEAPDLFDSTKELLSPAAPGAAKKRWANVVRSHKHELNALAKFSSTLGAVRGDDTRERIKSIEKNRLDYKSACREFGKRLLEGKEQENAQSFLPRLQEELENIPCIIPQKQTVR